MFGKVFTLCVVLSALLVVHWAEGRRGHNERPEDWSHNRSWFGRGRPQEWSPQELSRKLDRMEEHVNRFLDRAIDSCKRSNGTQTDLNLLQGLRQTDVPAFFNATRTKIRSAQNSDNQVVGVQATTPTGLAN